MRGAETLPRFFFSICRPLKPDFQSERVEVARVDCSLLECDHLLGHDKQREIFWQDKLVTGDTLQISGTCLLSDL